MIRWDMPICSWARGASAAAPWPAYSPKPCSARRRRISHAITCRSCRLVKAGTHPDLQLIQADGNSLKIDQMRAVRANVALKPLYGRRKVYLLAEMERLTEAAANSFLLTLEEPPRGVVFIGWADPGQALLPTIISRCQLLRLQPMTSAALATALRDRGAPAEEAVKAAAAANGLPALALRSLAATEEPEPGGQLLPELLRSDLAQLFGLADRLSKEEREAVAKRLSGVSDDLRDALLGQARGEAWPLPELSALPAPETWRLVAQVARTQEYLGANANIRLALEVLFLSFLRARDGEVLGGVG